MRVIDAHSHFFSRVYFETLAAMSPHPGTVAQRLDDLGKHLAGDEYFLFHVSSSSTN